MGVTCELGIEPGREAALAAGPDVGYLPDYRRAPLEPYQPAPGNYLRWGRLRRRKLWMVPVTTRCVTMPLAWHRDNHDGHLIEQLNLGLDPTIIEPMINSALSTDRVVVAVARTGDYSHANVARCVKANLARLLQQAATDGFAIEPPSAAIHRFVHSRRNQA